MKIKSVNYITAAQLYQKVKRNRIKGVYEQKPTNVALLKKKHKYDFDKEYDRYIALNYGDVLTSKDIAKLKTLVSEYVHIGKIQDAHTLHKYIKFLGKKHNLIFD